MREVRKNRKIRFAVACLAAFVVLECRWLGLLPKVEAEATGDRLSSRELAALQARFRATRGDSAARRQLVEEMATRGPEAAEAALRVIERELGPQLRRYHDIFYRQAAELAGKTSLPGGGGDAACHNSRPATATRFQQGADSADSGPGHAAVTRAALNLAGRGPRCLARNSARAGAAFGIG